MDWHDPLSVLPLVVLPLALFSQIRTRRLNIVSLLLSPVIYFFLGALAETRALAVGLGPGVPLALFGTALALGMGQGAVARVFYEPKVKDYRQRGGLWPLAFWGGALALREAAVHFAVVGLTAAQAKAATPITIDAALAGLLSGRALVLVYRYPHLWAASIQQLWGDGVSDPQTIEGHRAKP